MGTVAGITPWSHHAGVFYPHKGPNGKLLGCMLLEMTVVFLWGVVMAVPLFGLLFAMKKLQAKKADDGKVDA